MGTIPDWQGVEIEVASSVGGVLAVANPWENLVRTGIAPWLPPELLQKLIQSRHDRYFSAGWRRATEALRFWSDQMA